MNPNVISFPTPKESLKTILMRDLEELEQRESELMTGSWYLNYHNDVKELRIMKRNLMDRISEIKG